VTDIASPRTCVIVVAAGSGTRLGAGAPKAFVGLGDRTILRRALDGVFAVPEHMQVVVVAPEARLGEARSELAESGGPDAVATAVVGGETRQASVAAGLSHLLPGIEIVLVHDAARALTPPEVFSRVIERIAETGWGAMPLVPVIDTIKRVEGERVAEAVDRATLRAAQTPQGFRRDILEAAYEAAPHDFTDDAAVVMHAGHPVVGVEGSALGFKITTPDDLQRAEAILAGAAPSGTPSPTPRVGIGTDVHAYGGEGELWLAGLEWPGERALSGHSDGDAVAHAIVDALLSAAGLGDIGTHFGVDHPEFAGAHGAAFLRETHRIIREAGWEVGNVAVQFQASRPKFSPRRPEAEAALSASLGGAPVSVAATTTDGLGFTAADGVQAFATAVLVRA